jgi:RHS repeat-associated protein
MQYHGASYAADVWDTYYFEKNLQGDVVAVYDTNGTKLISYVYDAWGAMGTAYSNGGLNTTATKNPFRYRGYYYDSDLELYYLQTRYYDAKIGRFISPDTESVITATPDALTDKNLYAYCDNNPVMRRDDGGEFWLASVAVGLLSQYAGDVIANLISGKKGIDILKPTSSVGEYIAAGVTALIPGSGIGKAVVDNIVSEGISIIENKISGNDVNIANSIMNTAFGIVGDIGFEKISNVVTNYISSKGPQNYSSYAHVARKSNPKLTRNQIHSRMQRSIKINRAISASACFAIDSLRASMPY